ncbi:MAG: DUF2188 domain-containing protein [Bacteroidia bacterium]|nr:DUF2188 domain-containing protein [Bacteroidia bacterium]NNJ56096.1 DUF2188 domain-containing protein [Bacteroidia bacterium]
MANILESQFWINLIKKIIKSIAKDKGIRTSPRTWHQHVVPHKDGWAVKREGNKTYSSTHRKQSTAIRKAKTLARRYDADVIIHGRDGAIRDRISYD